MAWGGVLFEQCTPGWVMYSGDVAVFYKTYLSVLYREGAVQMDFDTTL